MGTAGFLHPESIYDEPSGKPLRRNALPRLRRHYQFTNERLLFPEVGNRIRFSINVYGSKQEAVGFLHIANLVDTSTIRASHLHPGGGLVPGIKNDNDEWSVDGHSERIVFIQNEELSLFSRLLDEDGTPAIEARIPALHARSMIPTLRHFANAASIARTGMTYESSSLWHESGAVKNGTIQRTTGFVSEPDTIILSGPHFFVGAPLNKTPRRVCPNHKTYDSIDLTAIPDDYLPRTNFVPACNKEEYLSHIPLVQWSPSGQPTRITDLYRIVVSAMLSPSGERTLQPALIPPGFAHIDNVNSYAFEKHNDLLAVAASWASLPIDFFLKTTGSGHLRPSLARLLPISRDAATQLFSRVLALNCITTHYSRLWSETFRADFNADRWTKEDPRLPARHFADLRNTWRRGFALRTDFARRAALLELDVIVAIGLGMTQTELINIYRSQFPVMRQNERDTWYDQNGRIIFSNSMGLSGVGLSRKKEKGSSNPGWEDVRDTKSGTVEITVDDDTMPGGPVKRKITYHAPFDRCDREADYAQAWAEFKKRGL